MAKKENNEDGVWRTINGRRVFIKNGQSLDDAMEESGKFNNTKTEVKKDDNKVEETEKELDEKYDKAHKKEDEEETEEELDKKYDEAHQKEETQDDAKNQVTSDDLNEDVNFKITSRDGSTKYINAFWSWNDLYEEDIPEGENLEDWRGIAYNILDENGEEIDGGMMITDQENFNAEELCRNLAEMSGYPSDIGISRIDNGDYEEAIENDKSSNEASDPYDDPESEESQRLQSIQSRYDDYLQKTEGRGASYGEIAHIESLRGKELDDFEKELDDFDEEESKRNKSTNEQLNDEEISKRVKENKIVDSYGSNVVYQKDGNNYITSRQNYNDYVNGKTDKLGGELVFNEKEARDRLAGYDADEKFPYKGYVNDEKTGNREKAEQLKQENLDKMYKSIGYDDSKYNYGLENNQTSNNEGTSNYDKYSVDEQDILDGFGEDYGWDNPDKLQNLKEQIDYMRNPGESIRQAARRYATGGSGTMLIYTEDAEEYLKERNIKYDKDDPFSKYADVMAEKIEKLYNDASNQTMNNAIREKANQSTSDKTNIQELINNNIKRDKENWEKGISYEDYSTGRQLSKKTDGRINSLKDLDKAVKSTNETMNNAIREKASKKKSTNDTDVVNDDNRGINLTFRTGKRDTFNVRYNRTGNNKNMDFATSIGRFNRNRTDYEEAGQGQRNVLQEGTNARNFFEKWDKKHLSNLTEKEYKELAEDIEKLKQEYPYIEGNGFNELVELDRSIKDKKKKTNDVMNDNIRNKAKKKK